MQSFSVKHYMLALIGLAFFAVIISISYATFQQRKFSQLLEQKIIFDKTVIQNSMEVKTMIVALEKDLYQLFIWNDPDKIRNIAVASITQSSLLEEKIQILHKRFSNNKITEKLIIINDRINPIRVEIIKLIRVNRKEEALKKMNIIHFDLKEMDSLSEKINVVSQESLTTLSKEMLNDSSRFLIRLAILSIGLFLAALLLAWVLSNKISYAIKDIISKLNQLAQGENVANYFSYSYMGMKIKEIEDMEGLIELTDKTIQKESKKKKELQRNAIELEMLNKNLEEKSKQELLINNQELTELNTQLTLTNQQLNEARDQLIQQEKLASIGQLSAGIAHEINTPLGYIFSNYGILERHLADFMGLMHVYVNAAELYTTDETLLKWLISERKRIDLDYTRDDILMILRESREGIEEIRKIVLDLKYFSHTAPHEEWEWADIERGLEATLTIVMNQIKYHADVVQEFEILPKVQCFPSQLNQVFINLLVNAAHAMEDGARGVITIRTGKVDQQVWIEVEDTGCGIPKDVLNHIFDPFFTTKPVGKGTGLGLSISYGIVKKHHGNISVRSEEGIGTCFRVTLPIKQALMEANHG
ncbi:MAG: ATP-binding protein [Pseudomonadota bacterium]